MKTLDEWFELYSVSHKNKVNKLIHKVCVPVIAFSVIGMLASLPFPVLGESLTFINWATLVSLISLIFYLRLGGQAFMIMLIQLGLMLTLAHFMATSYDLLKISITLFVLGWIGQFLGHKIEGKKPSFFEDLQFLLIGPLWVWIGAR